MINPLTQKKTRTEYSAVNASVAIIGRMIAILLGFAARVVFTHTLNEDYVGINGLFSDILNVLALSELGVGTAITYALYKPIAEGDFEKQKSLMLFFKKMYYLIAAIVFVSGLCVIPFFGILIKNTPNVDHLIILYLMYLLNTVLSYIGVYKRTLVDAYQMNYISVLIQTMSWALQNVIQIVILLLTRNFILYLSILILATILNNIVITVKADRMFPFLKDKNTAELSKEDKKSIFNDIKAMLMHKIGNVVVNNTDNLLLSALVGTTSVGLYSNYFLIIGSVKQILEQFFQSINASVGNMGAIEDKARIKKIFEATFFLGQWLYGLSAVCMFQILDSFVGFSFGKQYVFAKEITLILCINFYITGMRQATLVFRDSMGLFKYDRYKAIPEALINIVVSLVLGRMFGTIGIFIGTLVSTVTTSLWVEPYVLYKHRIEESSKRYFLKYALYLSVTVILWTGQYYLLNMLNLDGLKGSILKTLICFVVTNLVYLLLYFKTKEFKLLWRKGIFILKKKFGKKEENVDVSVSRDEINFLTVLKKYCQNDKEEISLTEEEWTGVYNCSSGHNVSALVYEVACRSNNVPNDIMIRLSFEARKTIVSNYRTFFFAKSVSDLLKEENIESVILKGMSAARLYPVPELRKGGDIDILITNEKDFEKAITALKNKGFKESREQHANHHKVMVRNKTELEVHSAMAEDFENKAFNEYQKQVMNSVGSNIIETECVGYGFSSLKTAYNGYELLVHMLQHFLREGFGLRLLCDWYMLWNQEIEEEEKNLYLELVKKGGIKNFSDLISLLTVRCLGLDAEKIKWMEIDERIDTDMYIRDILDAGEFGKLDSDRMIALGNGNIFGYIKTFHHQMHLNYPKAGKCFLLWPALWVGTLWIFLRNNRTIRHNSAKSYLKKAKERSKLVEKINLFK